MVIELESSSAFSAVMGTRVELPHWSYQDYLNFLFVHLCQHSPSQASQRIGITFFFGPILLKGICHFHWLIWLPTEEAATDMIQKEVDFKDAQTS